MDYDSLTLKELREILALFGGLRAAEHVEAKPPELPTDRYGKRVLVRSSSSGVWAGVLVARYGDGTSVLLSEARRLWNWQGAAECSALALRGPSSGKIGEPCGPIIHGVAEEHIMSDLACTAIDGVTPWVA